VKSGRAPALLFPQGQSLNSLFSKLPLFAAKGVDASHRPLGVGALQSIVSEGKNKAGTLSRGNLENESRGRGERADKSLSARDLLE
jgi:hypothetical protein